MANQFYPAAKQLLLEGQLNWLTDPIYAILLDTNYYTFSANHQSLADIDGLAFLASSGLLTGRTTTNGVADADDLVFSAITGGPTIQALVLVKDGGTALASKLIAYIDTAAGLPYEPNGSALGVQWSNSEKRIFAL